MIISNDNLKENVNKLIKMGYKYVVKANDKMLSYWGYSENKKHIHIIACTTIEELEKIKRDLQNDKSMSYIDWNYITNYNAIYNWARGKSFTIRNDWTRAFSSKKEKKAYLKED